MRAICVAVLAAGGLVAADVPPKELPAGRALAASPVKGEVNSKATAGRWAAYIEPPSVSHYTDGGGHVTLTVLLFKEDKSKIDRDAVRALENVKIVTDKGESVAVADVEDRPILRGGSTYYMHSFRFEKPRGAVKFLDIDIPLTAVGETDGVVKFRLMAAKWMPKKK